MCRRTTPFWEYLWRIWSVFILQCSAFVLYFHRSLSFYEKSKNRKIRTYRKPLYVLMLLFSRAYHNSKMVLRSLMFCSYLGNAYFDLRSVPPTLDRGMRLWESNFRKNILETGAANQGCLWNTVGRKSWLCGPPLRVYCCLSLSCSRSLELFEVPKSIIHAPSSETQVHVDLTCVWPNAAINVLWLSTKISAHFKFHSRPSNCFKTLEWNGTCLWPQ